VLNAEFKSAPGYWFDAQFSPLACARLVFNNRMMTTLHFISLGRPIFGVVSAT
jgi:hypothetical protein